MPCDASETVHRPPPHASGREQSRSRVEHPTKNGAVLFQEIASHPLLAELSQDVRESLRDYFASEKATLFGSRWVINTHFPPYPSRAIEGLAAQLLPTGSRPRLYSVTWAVTNRCGFACWHCYNAGRSQRDLGLSEMTRVATTLQDAGACMVTLGGGEPLLRPDLEPIVRSFDDRSCLTLNSTGWDLTERRARGLEAAGLFGLGVSLDSDDQSEHDRLRGRQGAFRSALRALSVSAQAGLYPYAITVARRELLAPERLFRLIELAQQAGAREVHLLEPCPSGRLAGQRDVVLSQAERARIVEYQRAAALRNDMPILSTFASLESPEAFGCGAGLTHLYIDGSGELCPCNLVPLSFGNVAREPLDRILARMGQHFVQPRADCVGRQLSPHVTSGPVPTPPAVSHRLCEDHLPREHPVPRFFQIRAASAAHAASSDAHEVLP